MTPRPPHLNGEEQRDRVSMSEALLELRGLTVDFATDDGIVHAVAGRGPDGA
jgi:hypothetical protein